ncbi:MAG: 4-hydroxy-tetrahydrodipicolinate synthase [Ruminococcaceae bacterium]|nr:4-hydroxy-tetrahydrodipicolinate synthase [Oscillospiraceae bacterium]
MANPIFTGSGVAIVTPFHENGVDFEKLTELLEFHVANDTDSIIICGTTGEASTMPDQEHLSVIEHAVKVINKRIPVIAGTGSNDTNHCIRLSQEAEKLGVDGLLLVTPYYNKTSRLGLIKHYEAVADAVNIPIILYNVPGRTGMNIPVPTLKVLAQHKNIVGIKEASGNISYTAQIAAKVPELDIYSGNDDMIVPVMSLGGKGVISVLANVAPKETHELCASYLRGDVETAKELQLKYLDLVDALFVEVNPIPVKTALNLMGMNVGKLRMPLCEMEEANLLKLKQAMIDAGISVK